MYVCVCGVVEGVGDNLLLFSRRGVSTDEGGLDKGGAREHISALPAPTMHHRSHLLHTHAHSGVHAVAVCVCTRLLPCM